MIIVQIQRQNNQTIPWTIYFTDTKELSAILNCADPDSGEPRNPILGGLMTAFEGTGDCHSEGKGGGAVDKFFNKKI